MIGPLIVLRINPHIVHGAWEPAFFKLLCGAWAGGRAARKLGRQGSAHAGDHDLSVMPQRAKQLAHAQPVPTKFGLSAKLTITRCAVSSSLNRPTCAHKSNPAAAAPFQRASPPGRAAPQPAQGGACTPLESCGLRPRARVGSLRLARRAAGPLSPQSDAPLGRAAGSGAGGRR